MDVGWLLIIGALSVVVLALECWSRLSGRSRRPTVPIGRTTRTRTTGLRPSPEQAASVSRSRDHGVGSGSDPLVVVSGRREPGRESAATRGQRSRALEATTVIRAPAARVWDTLRDFASYPCWNPYIRRIIGEAWEGTRIEVSIQPPGRVGVTYRPKLIEASAERGLRWRSRLLLPGVLDHEHQCLIEPLKGGGVRLVQREVYTGLLVPLLSQGLDGSTVQGFRAMHEALRERTEAENRP